MIPFFQGAASGAPAPGTVFAATLWTGNDAIRTITSGIDADFAWIKRRSNISNQCLHDTLRPATSRLVSNGTGAESTVADGLQSFTSTGFTLGPDSAVNGNPDTYVGWSFARAARFFDVVTYTGDGTSNRQISHALGISPGMVVVKPRNNSGTGYDGWYVRHRSATGTLYLNLTNAQEGSFSTIPAVSASTFTVTGDCNENGETYVAYLWAHDTASDGIVQCGSYTGDGGAGTTNITLGWKPQFILVKNSTGSADNWALLDTARGLTTGAGDLRLIPNASNAESSAADYLDLTSTGFKTTTSTNVNISSNTYVYLAIREA